MSALEDIRSRRVELLSRAAVARERLSVQIERWRPPLALADRGIALARVIRGHPEWMFAAATLVILLRPRRAVAWARRGFIAWRAWRWIGQRVRAIAGT